MLGRCGGRYTKRHLSGLIRKKACKVTTFLRHDQNFLHFFLHLYAFFCIFGGSTPKILSSARTRGGYQIFVYDREKHLKRGSKSGGKYRKMHFFEKKLLKNLVISKKSSTFAPAFEKEQLSGAVVQLVRIPACHAVGREFESRPHRKARKNAGFVIVVRTNLPKICPNCHLIRNIRRISF